MNSLQSFNQAMEYIEAHLEGEIDFERVAALSLCPSGLFARLFSVLCGMTLSEYMRRRRLTRAAEALRAGNEKVIDIALRFGYDSADAFTAAFRRFHGATPSQVRQGVGYQVAPPIRFHNMIQGGKDMDIRMERKPAFQVAGLVLNARQGADFGSLWDKLYKQHSEEDLSGLGTGLSLGVCYDHKQDDGTFSYMAGADVVDAQKAEQLGLHVLQVPEAEYAVVQLKGPMPECIHQGWQYLMGSFFPQQGYRHAGTPDFEVYAEGDMRSADYRMELWVPVIRA